MTLSIDIIHSQCKSIEQIIKSKNLNADCYFAVNFVGTPFHLNVSASEPYDANGYWRREKTFRSENATDIPDLFTKAREWAYGVPNEDDRAIELAIQRLNELADALPKGHTSSAASAWQQIHTLLKDKAAGLAHNGLPNPATKGD